jgi:Flp pilus assembly protein TadD
VQILTKVAQQQSSNAEVQFSLGVAYHQAGNLDKAAEQFKKAAMIDSDNWKYFFNAGIVESELGKFKRAIAAYEDALQIDPTNSKIHNNIGVIKQQQGTSKLQSFQAWRAEQTGHLLFRRFGRRHCPLQKGYRTEPPV